MKPSRRNLSLGQNVWGIVEEVIAQGEMIISFGGDMIRVSNETSKAFRPGQRVQLRVQALEPVKFKLITAATSNRNSHLDLTV